MSRKRRRARAKGKKRGQEPTVWPGLLLRIFLLAVLAIPLVLVYLVPLPQYSRVERPVFEDFRTVPKWTPPERPVTPPVPKPRAAIIIDDMGYSMQIDKKFIFIAAPLSFAFLPYAPFTKRLAPLAHKRERDILVHLPMEPENKRLDAGPGVLTLNMDTQRLLTVLDNDIGAVPYAVGVNNHMGSLFTQNPEKMGLVLAYLRDKGLFFIDSRTTANTVVLKIAREIGIPCSQRDVFLDHIAEKKAIKKQLEQLVKVAKKRGSAIGIGHPHKITYETLRQELPGMKRYLEIVPVHRLVTD